MSKKLLLMAATMAAFLPASNAQFKTAGIASFSGGVINLVPEAAASCGTYTQGAAWSTTTVDFTKSFTLNFDAALTPFNGGANGADGFTVTFGSDLDINTNGSVNGHGGYMGYYDNPSSPSPEFMHSMGIEFDVFYNADVNDAMPDVNHVMIAKNANPDSVLAPAVPIMPSGGSIEDGTFHHYRLAWDCKNTTLRVYYEPATDTARITMTGFNPATLFTNPAAVKWGFTSGRAFLCSEHEVKNVSMVQKPCDTSTAVSDVANERFVSIYPNPSNGVLNIEVASFDFNAITVFDIAGKMVYADKFADTQKKDIAMDKANSGIYILEVRSKTGEVYRSHFTIQ